MQTLIQKTILRKKQFVPQSLSLGKKGNENANEVPQPVVEIPKAKLPPVPHVSRRIAMALF